MRLNKDQFAALKCLMLGSSKIGALIYFIRPTTSSGGRQFNSIVKMLNKLVKDDLIIEELDDKLRVKTYTITRLGKVSYKEEVQLQKSQIV